MIPLIIELSANMEMKNIIRTTILIVVIIIYLLKLLFKKNNRDVNSKR